MDVLDFKEEVKASGRGSGNHKKSIGGGPEKIGPKKKKKPKK